jgi:hypothetical protein
VKLGKASGRTAEAVHINSMPESIHSTVPQTKWLIYKIEAI